MLARGSEGFRSGWNFMMAGSTIEFVEFSLHYRISKRAKRTIAMVEMDLFHAMMEVNVNVKLAANLSIVVLARFRVL